MNQGPEQWAREEFGRAVLGDVRRTCRAVRLASEVARSPSGTVTGAVQGPAGREAAFRFLNNPAVSVRGLGQASHEATGVRCADHEVVYVAVDQSSLGLTDRTGRKGFGPVGTEPSRRIRGFQVMSALAVSPTGQALGVCGQTWWRRPSERRGPRTHDARPRQDRESALWTRTFDQVIQTFARVGTQTRPWFQLDRGGDCYAVLKHLHDQGGLFTVRSAHDRRLAPGSVASRLDATLRKQRPLARLQRELPQRRGRPRTLELRTAPVTLALKDWDGDRRTDALPLWVVEVREPRRPRSTRIEWRLLTTYPVHTLDDALRVLDGYTYRWRVEEFHKTWKSGACQVERSQLRSALAFQRWATILAAVAARVEHLKYVARNQGHRPALDIASPHEVQAAIFLSRTRRFHPGDVLTAEQFVHLVAEAGGYTGKSSGGPPGSITIRRGLQQVVAAASFAAHYQKSD